MGDYLPASCVSDPDLHLIGHLDLNPEGLKRRKKLNQKTENKA
jgi:hypothetical protein